MLKTRTMLQFYTDIILTWVMLLIYLCLFAATTSESSGPWYCSLALKTFEPCCQGGMMSKYCYMSSGLIHFYIVTILLQVFFLILKSNFPNFVIWTLACLWIWNSPWPVVRDRRLKILHYATSRPFGMATLDLYNSILDLWSTIYILDIDMGEILVLS